MGVQHSKPEENTLLNSEEVLHFTALLNTIDGHDGSCSCTAANFEVSKLDSLTYVVAWNSITGYCNLV